MKHTYLHDVLPFLRELEREKQKQFEAYFRTAPLWLMDLFQSEIMEAGTTFIRKMNRQIRFSVLPEEG